MTDKNKPYEDLNNIKEMMERSTKFLSLSGLSGISAGILALIGAGIAFFIFDYGNIKYDEHFRILNTFRVTEIEIIESILILAIVVLFSAVGSGFFFSWRKSRKNNYKLWNKTSKRMLVSLLIPLIVGGFFSLVLIDNNYTSLLAGTTLIFYGLALENASKYTLSEIRLLGISEIILGGLACVFIDYGLLFWALGFGVLHIVYGSLMYWRYDRRNNSL